MICIDINDVDPALLRDIADSERGEFAAYEATYADATVSNQAYHVVFHAAYCRGGVVFVGSGSNGVTGWTDASSPAEALERFVAGNLRA